ncbi:MAG: SUMF1/EgtB/PvdO family nonheme iron enzyme [Bradyrhizobium sp.]|nr:SUMF1/EgtB/PvdO family nonheme iron enzyme [Bradyrhizobium sp.]
MQGRLPGGAIAFVIVLTIAALAAWYFLLQPSGRVAAERPSGTKVAATKPTNVPPAASPSPVAPTPANQPVAPATPATPVVVAPSTVPPSTVPPNAAVPSPSPSPTPSPTASVHAAETVGVPASAPAQPHQPSSRPSPQPTADAPPHVAEPEHTASVTPAATEPVMVVLPGGSFVMGSNDDYSERPTHNVTIKAFAIGKFPITVREWNACVAAKSCTPVASGKEDAPVSNLSWSDAQQFVNWLAAATGKNYRLPSEAEWEYAARAGTSTAYWWGRDVQPGVANCRGCNEPYDSKRPMAVGSFKPNPFGLYDMGGDVGQWVADCWHKDYHGAPSDGSPWIDEGTCPSRVFRSGSWRNKPADVRAASRAQFDFNARYPTLGLRVARSP